MYQWKMGGQLRAGKTTEKATPTWGSPICQAFNNASFRVKKLFLFNNHNELNTEERIIC